MKPRVSIIIPTYNRCKPLRLAIQSILNQSHQDYEILVCDDGSTDETKSMALTFNDKRIRWIPGPNSGGPAAPRNRGITESRGEWLAFLDSDDLWHPNKLEQQLLLCQDKNLLAVCTNASTTLLGAAESSSYLDEPRSRYLTLSDMTKANKVVCSSMLIHRSLLCHTGCFPEDPGYIAIEDYALWLSISILTNIYFVSSPLVVYSENSHDSIRRGCATSEEDKRRLALMHALSVAKKIRRKRATLKIQLSLYELDLTQIAKQLITSIHE